MSLDIIEQKKKYICIGNDLSNRELYASIEGEFRLGETYTVEGSMSGIYLYIFDKMDNYKAVVKPGFLELNFAPVKNRVAAPLISPDYGKFICIKDCETKPELYYTLAPKKFTNGRTYNIKTINSSPLIRYIYEDGPTLEHFIGCVNKSFVDENFLPRNKEYNIYIEVETLFDNIFFEINE